MAAQYAKSIPWTSVFIQNDPARQTEHEAWRDENGVELLRYLYRANTS
jgi:hypothetical protein